MKPKNSSTLSDIVAIFLLLSTMSVLTACNENTAPVETPPRPIKTFTVTEAVGGMIRRYSGISEAAETTALSFPVPGTIETLTVNVGENVEKDDIIAALDPEPFKLDVQAASAEVEKARASLITAKGDLERNKVLYDKNLVTIAAIEKFQAAHDSAVSTLNYARSRLAVSERNLANATLRAPFAGTVASRAVERYQDVAAGQPVVELNSTSGLLVSFSVPESAIGRLNLGQPVTTTFTAAGSDPITGRISEIESDASAGNAYVVKAGLVDPPNSLRPGMTAQVSISDAVESTDGGYLAPLSALVPGGDDSIAAVFKYDEQAGVVRLKQIRARGVRDNYVIVSDGLEPGDVIASAGVSFLEDGQQVRLLER